MPKVKEISTTIPVKLGSLLSKIGKASPVKKKKKRVVKNKSRG